MPQVCHTVVSSSFSDAIVEFIEIANINCAKFAKLVGCSKTTLSNWVNMKKLPNIKNVAKVAFILGVTPEYLLGQTAENKPIEIIEPWGFAKRIIRQMEKLKIKKSIVCEELDVANITFDRWIKEDTLPSAVTLARLAEVLSCSCDYLLGFSPYP